MQPFLAKAQAKAQLVFNRWNEKEDKYLILDKVTSTGLNRGDLIEVAVINLKSEIILHSFVKPDELISQEATEIHRITNNMIKNAPTWTEVLDHLYPLMQQKAILTYNEAVDESAFPHHYEDSSKKYYIRIDEYKRTISNNCVMHTYADLICSPRPVTLSEACGYLRKHRAVDACLATLAVIKNNYKPEFTKADYERIILD